MIVAIFGTKQLKSPKSIESMTSKFMDSVTTFSEKQKILQKVCKKVSIKTTLSISIVTKYYVSIALLELSSVWF